MEKKYIFEVIDGFTKFVRLYACKTTNTEEVIKHLKDYFRSYSKPTQIISDRGTCYTSNDFQIFVKEQEVKHILISTGTPRANEQIERINRTLIPMLAKLTQDLNRWDEAINKVEFAINNSIHKTTGTCPIKLLFGVEQRDEGELRLYLTGLGSKEETLEDLRMEASDKIHTSQDYNKKYYDGKHSNSQVFEVGDFVMIPNVNITPNLNKKLALKDPTL